MSVVEGSFNTKEGGEGACVKQSFTLAKYVVMYEGRVPHIYPAGTVVVNACQHMMPSDQTEALNAAGTQLRQALVVNYSVQGAREHHS